MVSPGGEHGSDVRRCSHGSRWSRSPALMATPARIPALTDSERAALMAEIRRGGETAASRRLGIPRQTMARALARLRIQAGSVLLIRSALAGSAPSAVVGCPPQQGAA